MCGVFQRFLFPPFPTLCLPLWISETSAYLLGGMARLSGFASHHCSLHLGTGCQPPQSEAAAQLSPTSCEIPWSMLAIIVFTQDTLTRLGLGQNLMFPMFNIPLLCLLINILDHLWWHTIFAGHLKYQRQISNIVLMAKVCINRSRKKYMVSNLQHGPPILLIASVCTIIF